MGKNLTSISAISPLDGRYSSKLEDVNGYFSEYALIRYRLIAELQYFYYVVTKILHKKLSHQVILTCMNEFNELEAEKIKNIEIKINHDVKAIEYYLQEKLKKMGIGYLEYIHFGLTSEDTNSIAYGLSLSESKAKLIVPDLQKVISTLVEMAEKNASIPMLARTHGQPAVPTTMGKEIIVFAIRLGNEFNTLKYLPVEAKITGAVGNYNAHKAGFPIIHWVEFCDEVVLSLGLTPNHFTTQILPADCSIKIFQSLELINNILIGLCQDMWRYISTGYFIQSMEKTEVGSSTMPQKVNPIDFENAEGNLGVANALFSHFITKLSVSRLQRDLSDSTVKRSIGSAIAYSILGYRSCLRGLKKISVNSDVCKDELSRHWEVISEGMQTIMRTSGNIHSYELMKSFIRGQTCTESQIVTFIKTSNFSTTIKKQLLSLTPFTYTGFSEKIVRNGVNTLQKKGVL
jgi:adenylosuccinate lyase